MDSECLRASNLVDLLRLRGMRSPNRPAFTFLANGERPVETMTYGEIDHRARAIATWMEATQDRGCRVVLVYPSGLEFITSFLACLYASRIAVPLAAPSQRRGASGFLSLVRDAGPSLILTTAALRSKISGVLSEQRDRIACVAIDREIDVATVPRQDQLEPIKADDIAFLQYTSGSTSSPRGVIVSHRNIVANQVMIRDAFGTREDSTIVSWLPLYHDMGLIGAVLQTVWMGAHCVLMSPGAFLEKPVRWLQTISRFGATISGGPDFAFRICAEHVTEEQKDALDLRTWEVAFNGAEPVRASTIRHFTNAFARVGFRCDSFRPCYGLAEATLLVTASRPGSSPRVARLLAQELAQDRATLATKEEDGSREIVSCGTIQDGQRILIVNPSSGTVCNSAEIGEIWISGPHVCRGYWNNVGATSEIFKASNKPGEPACLRTGDLGFIAENELFVVSRLKDVIIVRGRNYYPEDIEHAVTQIDSSLAGSIVAAFAVGDEPDDQLAIVIELPRIPRETDFRQLDARVRQTVCWQCEIIPGRVVFVSHGRLPKTTSGKVQRGVCRVALLSGAIEVLYEAKGVIPAPKAQPMKEAADANKLEAVRGYLMSRVSSLLQIPPTHIDNQCSLLSLGLDSLRSAELKASIESDLKLQFPPEEAVSEYTIPELSVRLLDLPCALQEPICESPDRPVSLSYQQRAFWFLNRLDPESVAYHVSIAARVVNPLNVSVFREALRRLMERHSVLRTEIKTGANGEPFPFVHPSVDLPIEVSDSSALGEESPQDWLRQQTARPFDLTVAPLFRVSLLTQQDGALIAFVFHHAIVDFWSLEILFAELGKIYDALLAGTECELPILENSYDSFVAWQKRMLLADSTEASKLYWRRELQAVPTTVCLPLRGPRPAVQSHRGATVHFTVPGSLACVVKQQAQLIHVSVHSFLLAVFELLIHNYCGEEEFLVGSPVFGRPREEWWNTVGLFINQLVWRAKVSGNQRFAEMAQRVHHKVQDGLRHQWYPFPLLVEELQPGRDPSYSPLFQLMFSFYQPQQLPKSCLPFLLGRPGGRLELGKLVLESVLSENRSSQLDLSMLIADGGDSLDGAIQYNSDLFDVDLIQGMARHFEVLLSSVAADPQQIISEISPLAPEDLRQVLHDWNQTDADYAQTKRVQHLFSEQAARTPSAVALTVGGKRISYAQLEEEARRVAAFLRQHGLRPGSFVGLAMNRSRWLLVGMLGILEADAAFVPVDPAFPRDRVEYMIEESGLSFLLTESSLASLWPSCSAPVICVDTLKEEVIGDLETPTLPASSGLAYLLYTSGSTGRPKGVMVTHRNVANFFGSMNNKLPCGPGDRFFAVTSTSFDISILELLWPLTRGAEVVLLPSLLEAPFEQQSVGLQGPPLRRTDFSLFYFASADEQSKAHDRQSQYKLLIEGAKFADEHDFCAVWTPERHFHPFGGLFPNPSVTSAALAMVTRRLSIRAGSVVLPIHNPIRVAEEWSVVDNLSNGRIALALASGWHADDFTFFPERYKNRREALVDGIATLRKLWEGQGIELTNGRGQVVTLRIYPTPVQPALPIWITAAGTRDTFIMAGRMGANILTHLLGQSVDDVAQHVSAYRHALEENGYDPQTKTIALMLHTFIGEDSARVRNLAREPFKNYLQSSIGLISNLLKTLDLKLDMNKMSRKDMNDLLDFAADRYFDTSALFGTVKSCGAVVERLVEIGIDEIACLIDFGLPAELVLKSLPLVAELNDARNSVKTVVATRPQETKSGKRIVQCTPSAMALFLSDPRNAEWVSKLDMVLLGGEPLPPTLLQQVRALGPNCRIMNMYGPTETTIWSTTYEPTTIESSIPIGRPIANTRLYILNPYAQPVPIGVIGELYIGGDGVADGYHRLPGMTAERFVPDPFGNSAGARLYRTGDLAKYLPDGVVQFVGRKDSQVKIRGFRIELGEVESVLAQHPQVLECVVRVHGEEKEKRIFAYVVSKVGFFSTTHDLRSFLKNKLPDYMVPSVFVPMNSLPRTANGKIDRNALPQETSEHRRLDHLVGPQSKSELLIAGIWRQVLKLPSIGLDDNFFDLGGHSLALAYVHQELGRSGYDLPLVKLLEYTTIRRLAAFLENTHSADTKPWEARHRTAKQYEVFGQKRNEYAQKQERAS